MTENREIKEWNIHLQKKCQNLQIAKWAMTHPIRPLRSVGGQTKSGLKHIYHRNIKKYKTTNVVKLLKNGYELSGFFMKQLITNCIFKVLG